MIIPSTHRPFLARLALCLCILSLLLLSPTATTLSQSSTDEWTPLRAIEADDMGVTQPGVLAYSPGEQRLFTAPTAENNQLVALTLVGDQIGTNSLATAVTDPRSAAFYAPTNELLFLDGSDGMELVQLNIGPRGDRPPGSQALTRSNARAFGIKQPQGITFDPTRRRLYILDTADPTPEIIRVTADPGHSFDGDKAAGEGRLRRTRLDELDGLPLSGIAYNPANGHLYLLETGQPRLHELSENGKLITTHDLSGLELANPVGIVFAPSADATDDPATMHLYIADSGAGSSTDSATAVQSTDPPSTGQIIELGFSTYAAPTALTAATLINTVDTSKDNWSPSSPDPAGVAYRPATGHLLISDSEVEENHPDYQGYNVFETTPAGTLEDYCVTTAFSNEPTGAAVNPTNGHIFFSDDNADEIFEVVPGANCAGYSSATGLDMSIYGSNDAEGLAFGDNKLFISDGVNREVYVVDLGADGVIGGGGANADTLVSQFDTNVLGLRDPEGLTYDAITGHLFLVSTYGSDDFLVETTTSGTAVASYDLSFLESLDRPNLRSGLAYAPNSLCPTTNSIYMVSRGVDNGGDPNENDGRMFEISLTGNYPPTVDAGSDQTITLPTAVSLNATASDDGLPDPPASLTILWEKVSGPGTVTFADDAALSTTATFSDAGSYVLRLTVNDSVCPVIDELTVTVDPSPDAIAPPLSIAASAPDAILSWDHIEVNDSYELWRSPTPYFTISSPDAVKINDQTGLQQVGPMSHTDVNALNTADGYFYFLRAIAGSTTADSNHVAKFTYTIVAPTP